MNSATAGGGQVYVVGLVSEKTVRSFAHVTCAIIRVGDVVQMRRAAGAVSAKVRVCAAAMINVHIVCAVVWVNMGSNGVRRL